MDNVNKLLHFTCSVFIFCIAIYLLINNIKTYHNTLSYVRDFLVKEEIYQQYYDKNEIVSYAEVIASLFNKLEYDIQIDDITIKRTEHDTESIKNYCIRITNYNRSYRYDNYGNMFMVIYKSIT